MSPAALFHRVNLDQGYLPFVQAVLRMVAACEARGAVYECTCLYRSFAEQKVDWCKGRTTPGPIVTDARPGESLHNFGLATDFMRRLPNGGVSWAQPDYDVLVEEAEREHLVSGRTFKRVDSCHVQWPGYLSAKDLLPLKSVYLAHPDAPLSAVFEYLNAKEKHV